MSVPYGHRKTKVQRQRNVAMIAVWLFFNKENAPSVQSQVSFVPMQMHIDSGSMSRGQGTGTGISEMGF